jgi:hypothetical protein
MRDRRLWQFILRGAEVRGTVPWFWVRFRAAARAVVKLWGPGWCRRRVAGELLGVWVLAAGWLVPVVLLVWRVGMRVWGGG